MSFLPVVTIGLWAVAISAGAVRVTAFDDDGAITVDGSRTFIIGSYAAAKSDRPYAELAEAGFNLVHSGPDTLDAAHEAGLMTWVGVGTIALDDGRQESIDKLTAAVNGVKDHPSLAFLESVDEPAWTWMKPEARVPAQAFAEAYPIIKQADPSHLLYMNHAPTNLVKTMRAYNAGTDIVACDIYPVNPGGLPSSMYALFPDGHQGDLNNEHISQVGEYVDKMRQVTGPDRPLFMVLQAFAWQDLQDEPLNERREEKVLYPTYAQSRFMAFQSIIKGANGIIYWGSHTMPQPSQSWSDIKRVVREVADLAPVLAERNAPLEVGIDYHEMGHSVDDGVQTLAKLHDGKLYLLTCNADKNLCKATLSGLADWTTCKVLNENRELPITNNEITDTWRRFEAHIYELGK